MREGWRPVYEGGVETCVWGRCGDLCMREGWRPVYGGPVYDRGVETCELIIMVFVHTPSPQAIEVTCFRPFPLRPCCPWWAEIASG